MGERKVQAKYYPPDFDPSKLPRIKKKRQNDDAVRFMLPMSVRCETCGEFMGTGLKFNARKSTTDEDYLGIRIFQFSMKCKGCPATFLIKTDPRNSDYICESGVRRNYEPWREKKKAEEEGNEERKRQDEDAIQALENKTIDAKQQMDDLDALDELKSLKAKRAAISVDDVLVMGKDAEITRNDKEEKELLMEAKVAFERKKFANMQGAHLRSYSLQNSTPEPLKSKKRGPEPSRVMLAPMKAKIRKKDKESPEPSTIAGNQRDGYGLVDYESSSDSD